MSKADEASPVQGIVGWRQIETAPKDGTNLLVWDGYAMTTAKWEIDYDWWEICVPSDGYVDSNCILPTHWMPLPEPPNTVLSGAANEVKPKRDV